MTRATPLLRATYATLSSHPFQVAASFVISYVLFRLLRVSDFVPTTALSLVRTSGLTPTLLGMLLQAFPWLLLLVLGTCLAVCCYAALTTLAPTGRRMPTLVGPVVATVALGLTAFSVTTPSPTRPYMFGALLAVVVLILSAVVLALRDSALIGSASDQRISLVPSGDRPGWQKVLSLAGVLSLLVALAQMVFERELWLPAELITVTAPSAQSGDGETVDIGPDELQGRTPQDGMLGYVLSEGPSWTYVLLEQGRVIVILANEDITTRTTCRLAGQEPLTPILTNLLAPPDLTLTPACS